VVHITLGLAAVARLYALLQNMGEDEPGKRLLKPVDRQAGDAVMGEGLSTGSFPRVLDPDNDGGINAGPTS